MSAVELGLIGAVVLLAASIQTTAGFGFSLTAVPMMALFTETRTASMVAAVLSMGTSGFQAWHGRRDTDWISVRRLCLAAGLGLPFGLVMFDLASEDTLRLFLGATTLLMVVLLARGLDLSGAGPAVDWAAGVAAGVLSTSLSTNGPPLVFVLQGRRLPPARFRASITTVFVVVGSVGLAGRAAVGGFTRDVGQALLVAPVPLALGTVIGFRLRRHVDGDRFTRVVLVLLALAAASAIIAAL